LFGKEFTGITARHSSMLPVPHQVQSLPAAASHHS
jgi:hypothetical protein